MPNKGFTQRAQLILRLLNPSAVDYKVTKHTGPEHWANELIYSTIVIKLRRLHAQWPGVRCLRVEADPLLPLRSPGRQAERFTFYLQETREQETWFD